jgi:cation diffusion facilitator family transporter
MSAGHTRAGLVRFAQGGMLLNALLAVVKGLAGVLGNSYALVADAVESASDVAASLVVWGGLRVSGREADARFPYGYGKAEAVAAVTVSLFLVAAACGIAIEAVREIRTPHHAPAPFTLAVLIAVIVVKEGLFRRVAAAGIDAASPALVADAWHHRSDAISSGAAFLGITIALLGGPGWESADDWAALVASTVIVGTAVRMARPSLAELMDATPAPTAAEAVAQAAGSVPEVLGTHAIKVRRAGGRLFVDLHVEADGALSLDAAHVVSGKVKGAIRSSLGAGTSVLVHMEPAPAAGARSRH